MAIAAAANIFSKCLPAIGNNINECGAVTLCNVITAESDELDSIFTDGAGNFRDLDALLHTQFEIKACGQVQNGLYDFLMSNKRMLGNRRIVYPLGPGNAEIAPFVMAHQHSVINDVFWSMVSLVPSGNNYSIHVRSRASLPLDTRWFVPGMSIFVSAQSAAGTSLRGSFLVTGSQASTFGGNATILVSATGQNTTLGDAAKATFTTALTAGVVIRGSANVQDTERWCHNRPALNDRKHVPFWFETDRYTMCTDQYYEAWFKRLQGGNPYFKLFGNVDTAVRNRQLGAMFQREWLNKFFWNKPISTSQTLANYRSLQEVQSFSGTSAYGLYTPNEGRCVGRKANAIGVYEQLAECGQVFDLQGQTLNLNELFQNLLYPIWRARGDQGIPNKVIEMFTDTTTASMIKRGMIKYYDNMMNGLARFNVDAGKCSSAEDMGGLGFNYDEYCIDNPVVKLRVVTHPYFDDNLTAHLQEGIGNAGRFLWILDFTSIWPGIITSNRKVHRTGEIEALARVDSDYACVMENPTQEIALNSLTWTAVVECPLTSAIIEGFSDAEPIGTGRTYPYQGYSPN